MFERFTERARQVVVLAQDEARAFGHDYIGTEHLLLGLLREEQGVAVRVLSRLGVRLDDARAHVERIIGRGEGGTTGQIPFTPRGKKVLELSLRESQALGHNYIGTEHILLGIVREGEGVATEVLDALGVPLEDLRDGVIGMLGGPADVPRAVPVPPGGLRARRVRPRVPPLLEGWLLFGVALGIGVLVGWAIWG